MRRLVLATGNPGKIRELKELLAGLPFAIEAAAPGVEETGATFEENALLKARAAAKAAGAWALADDSGLEVEALGGRPGVHSARYAGPKATEEENNRKLIAELRGVPPERRAARYRAVAVVVAPDGAVMAKGEGACEGVIRDEAKGAGGFGYDPHFFLPEFGMTMAELPLPTKNGISHRGWAIRAVRDALGKVT